MFEVPADDQLDNKENVVLRSVASDPNRHTPTADHYPLEQISPASMYTMETRYQPNPAKALPKSNDPRVYYIDSDRRTPTPMPSEQPTEVPTAFLEPKVISQPVFYSVMGTRSGPVSIGSPVPQSYEQESPTIYSIVDRPRRATMDITDNNLEAPKQLSNNPPTVYSIVGGPRIQNFNEEPINQPEEPVNQHIQTSPYLYSLIGSPARTSRATQVNTLDPEQPAPIVYTILDDTPIQTSRLNEKDLSSTRKPPVDATVYTLGNQTNTPRVAEYEQPIQKPLVYALVDAPYSPPFEKRAKQPGTKKFTSPPTTTTVTTTRRSSFERKPEVTNDEMISYPVIKGKPQPLQKESKTNNHPAHEEDRRIRRPPPQSQSNPKSYSVVQYPPIQLPDYQSPYAARTYKPYRQRKFNNNALPVIAHNPSDRKARPPLYEPRYRNEKQYPYVTPKPSSLERYPVSTKTSSSLWDNGYQTQTDDEEYDQGFKRKKRHHKTSRPRAPWIPVW